MNEGRAIEEDDSGPCAEISADHSSAKRQQTPIAKILQSADVSSAPERGVMRGSDALLTLVGEIIHVDPDGT